MQKVLPSLIITIIIILIFFYIFQSYDFLGLIGIAIASWVISNILVIAIQQLAEKIFIKKFQHEKNLKQSISMLTAHLGIGLLILGITGSSIWQEEKIIRMQINDEASIKSYNILFKKIDEISGPNYVGLQGSFWVYNKNKKVITVLEPENRFYPVTNNSTTEASIHTNLFRDLYMVLGDGNINDGWIVRFYYNPLVVWIWIGVFVTFIGGLFAIYNNLKILKRLN